MSFLLYLGSLPNGFIQFGGFIKHWDVDDFQISIYSQSCGPLVACNFWNLIYINYIEIKISSSVVTAKFVMLWSERCKWLFYKTAKIWNHSNDCYVFNYYSTSTLATDTPNWTQDLTTPGLPLVFLISLDHIWILLIAHSEKFTLTSEFLVGLSCLLANVHNSPRIEDPSWDQPHAALSQWLSCLY